MKVNKIAQLTGHNASIFALSPYEETDQFLSGAGDGWVVKWNFKTPEMGRLIAKVETQIFSLLNLSDTPWVVVGNMNGGMHWVHVENPDLTKNIAHHGKGVFGLVQVGEFIYSIGGDGLITRWSYDPIQSIESVQLTNTSLRSIDYSEARQELVVGASDNAIYFLDSQTLALKKVWKQAHDNSVFTVKYHPNRPLLLSGGRDAMLKVWSLDEDQPTPISAQAAHWFTINEIAFDPHGRWFATGSRDKTIKIWDAQNFKLLKVLETVRDKGHLNSVNSLYWSPYRNFLVSCSDDRSMIIWEVLDAANI